jgi:hypothetical protein
MFASRRPPGHFARWMTIGYDFPMLDISPREPNVLIACLRIGYLEL